MTESAPSRAAPWGDHPLPAHRDTACMDFGPLRVWIRTVENEVWLAHRRAQDGPLPATDDPPLDAEWVRWALPDDEHHLRISPSFPDRMMIVKTEFPFTLLRKASARVFMRVGAWIRFEVVGTKNTVPVRLQEIPTEVYSDTWWGDFREGELGYWLTTKARREISDALFEPHLIVCVLQLTNRSRDDLPVEKVALRVEHLSIFEKGGRLWAEETLVEYQGDDLGSDIHMNDLPPREAADAREITPARAQVRGLRARTFARLKAWSTLGMGGGG